MFGPFGRRFEDKIALTTVFLSLGSSGGGVVL